MSLLEILQKGGPVNWVLLGFFFLSMVIVLERLFYFFTTRYKRKDLKNSNLSLPLKSQPGRMRHERDRLNGAVEDQKLLEILGASLVEEMEQGLWFLSFVTACAPSLGLLGTVMGLIKAFRQLAAAGNQVDMQLLSGGIWEAMLTTACGLVVAIPVLFSYRCFRKVVEKRITDLNSELNRPDDKDESISRDSYNYA
ncbi:MAG: MotA/TolQ/ExbB proton channel family protein [Spirochaetales bacterium]|nr:MotA/TolQ/ExbB proton channel family protein [Spirochaetales bacterium]